MRFIFSYFFRLIENFMLPCTCWKNCWKFRFWDYVFILDFVILFVWFPLAIFVLFQFLSDYYIFVSFSGLADWFNFQSIYFSLWHFKRFWLSDYSKQWFIFLSCVVRFSDIFLWVSLESQPSSQQRDLVLLSADQKAIRSDPSIPPTIRLRIKMQRNGFRFRFRF